MLKMSARTLDELEATMADRGIIRIMQHEPDGRGRPAKVWGLQ
jgi:predicted ArsR family transcriptional regulator